MYSCSSTGHKVERCAQFPIVQTPRVSARPKPHAHGRYSFHRESAHLVLWNPSDCQRPLSCIPRLGNGSLADCPAGNQASACQHIGCRRVISGRSCRHSCTCRRLESPVITQSGGTARHSCLCVPNPRTKRGLALPKVGWRLSPSWTCTCQLSLITFSLRLSCAYSRRVAEVLVSGA